MLRKALFVCGLLSSLLYLAADVIGGLTYGGYSFASQAVSELMAIGAPSEPVVDPLFIAYGLLVTVFGIGVMWEGTRNSRALRVAGAVLVGYSIIGLTGPTLFEMHPRGTSNLAGDRAHIALTAVLVVLVIAAILAAASAFGDRFRVYSFATLMTMFVAGVVSAPYGPRLAAGEPTPGLGFVERAAIYASLLWVAILAVVLLRIRQEPPGGYNGRLIGTNPTHGRHDPVDQPKPDSDANGRPPIGPDAGLLVRGVSDGLQPRVRARAARRMVRHPGIARRPFE